MIDHACITDHDLFLAIKFGKIKLGGNKRLKIFGRLNCKSGKRMKRYNRVFFVGEEEAMAEGYRPCGHCLRKKYTVWKTID